MASPLLSVPDEQSSSSPHNHPQVPPPPDFTFSPSPTLIAAATTLAALSDDRPPTAAEEYDNEDLDDDDYTGGISLTATDFQDQPVDMSFSLVSEQPEMTEPFDQDAVVAQIQSAIAQYPSFSSFASTAVFELSDSTTYPVFQPPLPAISSSHSSNYDPSLEPPPAYHQALLSIQDNASFAPITSFFHYLIPGKRTVPGLDLVVVPDSITREDLQGDKYDWQGIDWVARKTTRAEVRRKRVDYESKKIPQKLKDIRRHISPTPNTESFFQFRRNNTRHRAFFPHFQLRNVLTVTSRNDIFYAAGHRIFRTDANGSPADTVIDLSKRLVPESSITTIASLNDVLIAGAFEGEFAIMDLRSTYGSSCAFGRATDYSSDAKSRISNHMHLFESRTTYVPQAVLCSNDDRLRVLDCATNKITHSFGYSAAVNSSATSPDGRMRVLVGDFQETLITNAETGQAFETLKSHTDDAFACAWADDGIHVATAAQDSTIVVWDARNWSKPLSVMASEVNIPRSLHFSPIGSGPRVLVAAEADDYINVINAQTFKSKQVFDFFGPIGGASFTPDGQSLFVANAERRFGGIVELDRTGRGGHSPRRGPFDDEQATDWAPDSQLYSHARVLGSDIERERRDLDLYLMV